MKRILTILLVLGVGVFIVYDHRANLAEERSSQRWPETKGYLLESKIERIEEGDPGHNDHRIYYQVRLSYEYNLDGHWYRSARDTVVPRRYAQRGDAEARVTELKTQKTLTVYYDPQDPAKSILTR